ncbi:MAG: hypothetical protein HC866_13000 [Leptolyngbyaceae cyanobacterium RU_5_1]|nr:hypothetical protein [Leptolyngbyaceae cyanobacterium RU_5_1]
MSNPQTINVQLSPDDRDRLKAEARRRNLSVDVLASVLLHERLATVKQSINPDQALFQLREIGRKMPPIDALQLAQKSRRDLEQRRVL